jgi:hypothetical protein
LIEPGPESKGAGLPTFVIGVPPSEKVTGPPGPAAKLLVATVAIRVTIAPSATVVLLVARELVTGAFVTEIAELDELLDEKLLSPR